MTKFNDLPDTEVNIRKGELFDPKAEPIPKTGNFWLDEAKRDRMLELAGVKLVAYSGWVGDWEDVTDSPCNYGATLRLGGREYVFDQCHRRVIPF